MNTSQRLQPIAVVGGGLAGIAASLTLADAGHPVVLLEARRRLGGRAGSFFDETKNHSITASTSGWSAATTCAG
jgi:uncharacterized protein with NAD-binding domain and iron-sulfur cluster